MIYDTEDPTLIAQINAEMKLIRDMVVVSELSFVASGAANAGFQVTLKCYAARQQQGSCRKLTMFLSIYHTFLLENL